MNRDLVTIPIRDRSKKPEVAYSKHDGVIVINITKPEQAECFICEFCLFCHPEFIDKTWETQGGKAWKIQGPQDKNLDQLLRIKKRGKEWNILSARGCFLFYVSCYEDA